VKIGDIIVVPDGELPSSAASSKTTAPVVATTKKLASVSIAAGVANSTTGYFMRPLVGGVKTQGIHGNNGVDLADSCGTPLYAAASGKVIVSKNNGAYNGGYGNYVVINHDNGMQTLYGHMESVAVDLGATVTKGQYIGTLGNTGKVHGVTGCHVHFEVHGGKNPF
jgi:murein DD-endopeptidase MepM/ murein hydrolase activator NlpD